MATEAESTPGGRLLGGGKYRVLRHIGTGGMGAVYEGVNVATTRKVALKILLPEHAAREGVARRFTQEARAASRIEHPNIIGVFDLVQDGETLFIVEEFLEGEDLKQRVGEQGPLSPLEALRVLVPVMDALAYAHERGVVHRDVKPDNIFLARGARGVVPKLIDFGIARVLDDEGESLHGTVAGEVVGTTAYMSPEQARGDVAQVGPRADVWAVGATLYFALTGQRPFEATNRNQMLFRIIHEAPPPLEIRCPDAPQELLALVQQAMEKDFERRHPSMQHLYRDARACLQMLEERTELVRTLPLVGDDATVPDIPLNPSLLRALSRAEMSAEPPRDQRPAHSTEPPPAPAEPSPTKLPAEDVAAASVDPLTPERPAVTATTLEHVALPEETPADWSVDTSARSSQRGVVVGVVVALLGFVAVLALVGRDDPPPTHWTAPVPSRDASLAMADAAVAAPDVLVAPDRAPDALPEASATPRATEHPTPRPGPEHPSPRPRGVPLAPNPYDDEMPGAHAPHARGR